jgi:hypothetical protein
MVEGRRRSGEEMGILAKWAVSVTLRGVGARNRAYTESSMVMVTVGKTGGQRVVRGSGEVGGRRVVGGVFEAFTPPLGEFALRWTGRSGPVRLVMELAGGAKFTKLAVEPVTHEKNKYVYGLEKLHGLEKDNLARAIQSFWPGGSYISFWC